MKITRRCGNSPQNQSADAFIAAEEAEKGMAEMSRVYNEGGRELYIGAGDRERD
jgi:phosphomethylpyrimidine synthase